jgi:hypothetical protein
MERIVEIQQGGLIPQSSDSVSLTTRSGPPLPAGMGLQLAKLMAQTQARYPNQTLPEGTPDMYLVEWEEVALEFGLEAFKEGLSKAIRENRFFPDPHGIKEHCVAMQRDEGEHRRGRAAAAQVVTWREQWERERAEP